MLSRRRPAWAAICSSRRSEAWTSSRMAGSRRSPAAVRRTPDRSRIRRGKPVSRSRAFIMWVRPDWVISSCRAARVKLPDSTAASREAHFLVSMACYRVTLRMSSMRPRTRRCSSLRKA